MKPIPRRTERTLRWIVFSAGSLVIWAAPGGQIKWLVWVIWGVITLQAWETGRTPVLMYHSISNQGAWIREPSLVVPVNAFDAQMKWLTRLGYHGLFLDELYECRRQGRSTGRAVALTFDDGYLDNWIGAYHVLERYRMKGTIFVSTQWLDSRDGLRPRLPQADESAVDWTGYLGPPEIKALQDSGLVDIQSHAVTHDHVFVSDELTGFAKPGNRLHTIFCHLHPEAKPEWFKGEAALPPGFPLFPLGEALAGPAFHPDHELVRELTTQAAQPGFFELTDWEDQLKQMVRAYRDKHGCLGRLESMEEARARWQGELEESRRTLEMVTGKPVRHLAWPRNKANPEVERLALELGYLSTTTVAGLHNTSREPQRVERVAIVSTGYTPVDVGRIILEILVFKGYYLFWPLLFLLQRLPSSPLSRLKQ